MKRSDDYGRQIVEKARSDDESLGEAAEAVTKPEPPPVYLGGFKPALVGGLASGIAVVVLAVFAERNRSEININSQSQVPQPSKSLCDGIAEKYDAWFRGTHAGLMTASPIGLELLKTDIRSFNFATWGAAFNAYWSTTLWTPSGPYVGGAIINAPIIGIQMQSEIDKLLSVDKPSNMVGGSDAFAERIADILHTYTTKLQVQTALNIAPYTKTETVF